ncbi:hypothetical protein RERY_66350 [Rhodococcus erythropolis]|nr:hypothetical protein RERY_66350 [Rhodococcus erythropolis]
MPFAVENPATLNGARIAGRAESCVCRLFRRTIVLADVAADAVIPWEEKAVILAGVKTKCHMFAFRLSHPGKSLHRVYSTQGQEGFLEGHIVAFDEIDGVPTRHIRYDNLTAAGQKVIYGQSRPRVENPRWVLFRSHFGFDPFYCQPGISGTHEKGGAEGEVGRFRRNRLSPMLVVDYLDERNEKVRALDTADNDRRINDRRINDRIRPGGQNIAVKTPLLPPVPDEEFDPGFSSGSYVGPDRAVAFFGGERPTRFDPGFADIAGGFGCNCVRSLSTVSEV